VHADEKLTAFAELESAIRTVVAAITSGFPRALLKSNNVVTLLIRCGIDIGAILPA
jgi:hypothetical protein